MLYHQEWTMVLFTWRVCKCKSCFFILVIFNPISHMKDTDFLRLQGSYFLWGLPWCCCCCCCCCQTSIRLESRLCGTGRMELVHSPGWTPAQLQYIIISDASITYAQCIFCIFHAHGRGSSPHVSFFPSSLYSSHLILLLPTTAWLQSSSDHSWTIARASSRSSLSVLKWRLLLGQHFSPSFFSFSLPL